MSNTPSSGGLFDLLQNARFQVIFGAAVLGYILGSLIGGFLGLLLGFCAGFLFAIFTFGLSVPLGALLGAFIGGILGAFFGAISGACIGLACYSYRHLIGDVVNRTWLVILTVVNVGISTMKPFFQAQAKWQAGCYDNEKVRQQIKYDIQSSNVVMYSYKLSPFCIQAERLLKLQGINVKTIDLGIEFLPRLLRPKGAAIRAELGAMTGQTSMPHIFIGGKSIGGLLDGSPGLLPLIEKGELRRLIDKGELREILKMTGEDTSRTQANAAAMSK